MKLIAFIVALFLSGVIIAQVTYNTFVVTGQGQFVNARLSDNVYIDMSTSPPTLRAKRVRVKIYPFENVDGTWQIPGTLESSAEIVVYVNGLLMQEGVSYLRDATDRSKLVPWDASQAQVVKWRFISDADPVGTRYQVQVHIYP
jgi:hypothetical protein